MRLVYAGFEIRERGPDDVLLSATARDTYYPVAVVTPLEGNEAAVGFDLGSNAVRLEALNLAIESGALQVTQRIRWLSLHLHPMLTPDGGFRGMQGVFHDITHRVERQEQLERDASTDPLTGLANRRHLDEFLNKELVRAKRDETPLSLLLLDLDHFKRSTTPTGMLPVMRC